MTALPLHSGDFTIGAVSLYCTAPVELNAQQLLLASDLGILLSRATLTFATRRLDEDAGGSPADVRSAARTLSALTGAPPAEALLTVRAYASRTGRSLRDIAADISGGRFPFSPDQP